MLLCLYVCLCRKIPETIGQNGKKNWYGGIYSSILYTFCKKKANKVLKR